MLLFNKKKRVFVEQGESGEGGGRAEGGWGRDVGGGGVGGGGGWMSGGVEGGRGEGCWIFVCLICVVDGMLMVC